MSETNNTTIDVGEKLARMKDLKKIKILIEELSDTIANLETRITTLESK